MAVLRTVRRRWLARSRLLFLVAAIGACGDPKVDTSWHQESGYRWRQLAIARGATGLRKVSNTGVTHRNDVDDARAIYNRQLLTGAGVAAGDIDGDGLPDLFFASVEKPAALYHNDGGFKFTDVTASSGIDTRDLASTSALFADLDGDGNLDVVVGTLGGPVKMWRGDGKGHFTDVTPQSGLVGGYAASTMTVADVDGDGDLDLYVGTYKTKNALDIYTPQQRAFEQVVKKVGDQYQVMPQWQKEFRIEDHPELGGIMRSQRAEPDLFFVNDGKGHFTHEKQVGARWRDENGKPLDHEPDYFTLASRFYDVNNDGAPDLYVCNDFEDPDQFWINDGKGNFRLTPWLSLRETSNTCMSVDFGDINRDGHVDFFTADMMSPTLAQRQRQFPTHTPLPKRVGLPNDRQQWMRNMLQLSRGDGTWASIGDFAGVSGTDWTWGSAFLDVDLDGYEDLIAVNGHRWDVRDADTFERIRNSFPRVPWNREQGEFPRSATRSVVFRNNHDLTFTDKSREWGLGSEEAISQGIALADLDGDGDMDVIVTRLDAPPAIYRNESPARRVAIRLRGAGGNREGIGAIVTASETKSGAFPKQSREMTAGGYYLSGSEAQLQFAVPPDDSVVSIDVKWRSGKVSHIDRAIQDRLYEVDESSAVVSPRTDNRQPKTLFADATPLLGGHTHVDSAFDDYARQPLLPGKLSQLGPGVTWTDVDGDGRVDLVVAAGHGGRPGILRNTGSRFVASPVPDVKWDLTTILPVPGKGLIAGQSNYEATSAAESKSMSWVASLGRDGRVADYLKGDSAAVGPLALADVNGDGLLDLFVGARSMPAAWPLPGASHLYLRRPDGQWVRDTANERALHLGNVSAALLTDLDGDGWPELVTTAEWGPVRVLQNKRGKFSDVTAAWGLSSTSSRWNGLSAGDFDGDGRLDLVVTSWGRNYPVHPTPARPHVLIVGKFGGKGLGLVFAQADSMTGKEMPLESFARIALAVPSAKDRIPSFAAYARATADEVIHDPVNAGIPIGATTYDHLLLLNRGGRFEARPLPIEAQLAPAFAPVVADFDGDGREDLFLAQNFSFTEIETPRLDAGKGLMLFGTGADGRWSEWSTSTTTTSGVRVLGDQRGAAAADYDGDGRVDLAVSQNGAATTLWHNVGAVPGIRVRVNAGVNNPYGIGAQLRVVRGKEMGPLREIRAGSAYWSMDDPVTVLAGKDATAIWVRFPGGVEKTIPLAKGQREITVTP